MKKFALGCTICFFGLMPVGAQSYNNTVHFFQTAVVVEHLRPSITNDEKRLVALCAQLPDETVEYDAVKQYKKFYWQSEWFGEFWDWGWTENHESKMRRILAKSKATRELITVQQLLHGLTGGDAEDMLKSANNILKKFSVTWKNFRKQPSQPIVDKAEILCAIGFAVHLLGDTIAHRRLDGGGIGEPGLMYPTGMGHAYDGKMPDNLLESVTGLKGIKYYNNEIPILFPDRTLDVGKLRQLDAKLEAANELWLRWRAGNKARKEIIDKAESWAKEEHLRPDEHENETCQFYLNSLIEGLNKKKNDMEEKLCAPKCSSVFTRFADIAKAEFEDSHKDRLPALSLDEYVYPSTEGNPLACPVSN